MDLFNENNLVMITLNFGQKQMYWNAWLIHLFINSGPTPLPSLSLSQDISEKRSRPTELLQHAKLVYKTKEQNNYIFYADIALSCQIHSLIRVHSSCLRHAGSKHS